MRKLFFIILWMSMWTISTAQQPAVSERPLIEVQGQGELEVDPDEIYIKIILTERAEGRDKITITKLEDLLKREIKDLGIDLSHLTIDKANADYQRFRALKKEVIQTRLYTLKVKSAEELIKVYDRLDKINVTDVWIDRITHSKLKDYENQAREMAVRNARARAEQITGVLGYKIGMPLFINENVVGNDGVNFMKSKMLMAREMDDLEMPEPIQFGKIKITASVYIKFEIKQ